MSQANLRLPAEWEPQSAVQFTLPHEATDWADMLEEVMPCFVACIEAVSLFEPVVVVCDSKDKALQYLGHISREKLRIFEIPSNDTWARDHGGIVIIEDGKPILLDFMFTGWGLKFPADKDNRITERLADFGAFGETPLRKGGMVLEGGAIESDGSGTLLTTAECLLSPNRNPHWSKAETEQALVSRFGLKRVLWLNHGYLAGDDTDSHIDTLARFCDPNTIAYVQCADPNDEHFEALGQMEVELKSFRTLEGKPYTLVPLPVPRPCYAADGHRLPATYANFLIINSAVLIPTYEVPEDDTAIAILEKCFPDRKVIGINCRPLIEQHGSLHCISMQYPSGVVL